MPKPTEAPYSEVRGGLAWLSRRALRAAPNSLRARATTADRMLIGPLLLGSMICLGLGIFLPGLSVETLPLLEDEISIYYGVIVLWSQGQYFLFAVLVVFSVIFPVLKLALALWVWYRRDSVAHPPLPMIRAMERLAKWSMLDVLVIAIIVAALNLTVIAGVFVHPGLYLFTVSIVLSMSAMWRLEKIAAWLHPTDH